MGDVDDGGFTSTSPAEDRWVCDRCFGNQDIQEYIRSEAESHECDFCGRVSRKRPIAADLPAVVEFMLEAIDREYEHAVNALGWDGREGGFQGIYWDSYDLLTDELQLDLPNDEDGELLQVLVDCLGDQEWCQRDPYAMRPHERLFASWTRFCEFVKHERRYFFLNTRPDDDELLDASRLLRLIGKSAEEYGLISDLRPGFLIRRARMFLHGQTLRTPRDFGPPPIERAVHSNRMSPAGIVMLYGSDSAGTAIAEVDDDDTLGLAIGTFRTLRPVKILDLTRLPRVLRFFERQPEISIENRDVVKFLNSFATDLARKIERDDREHFEYVPTQVVTEWFRHEFKRKGGQLDGICYPSAQLRGGRSFVLFADQDSISQVAVRPSGDSLRETLERFTLDRLEENSWLCLVRTRTVRHPLTRRQLARSSARRRH
jgi:HEPN/RES N-terminal domain 1/RES domain